MLCEKEMHMSQEKVEILQGDLGPWKVTSRRTKGGCAVGLHHPAFSCFFRPRPAWHEDLPEAGGGILKSMARSSGSRFIIPA